MATSSIFSNVVISSEESAKAIIRAFEDSQKHPKSETPIIDIKKATDAANMKRVLNKLGGLN